MTAQHNPFSALRDAARARRAAELDDASWVERAAGRLSPADEAALEAFGRDDPLVQHMRVVTAPPTQAEQEKLEASVLDAAGGHASRVVALRSKRSRVIALSTLLAAAAAVLLMVRAPEPEHLLPRYEGSLAGSDAPVRSTAQVPTAVRARLSPGALVTLTAQPVDALPEGPALAARLFIVQGATAAQVDVPIEVAPTGAVRVAAPYTRLFGERRGELDLLLFLGSLEALPDAASAPSRAAAPGVDLAVLRFPVALDLL